MFNFSKDDYAKFLYGIITRSALKRQSLYAFTLWGRDLILFWNDGDPKCYQNFCPHYGLPLDQGKITGGKVSCGFHGWTFDLKDGALLDAPLARNKPDCALQSYQTYSRGNMVFVYPGSADGFERAKSFILDEIPERCLINSVPYEVPFYLAMNSSMDFPHHAYHTYFYDFYGLYRKFFGRKNPLKTSYTPEILSEDEKHFKYRINENQVEVTVHPFCSEYHDVVAKAQWQIFVRPISHQVSQYTITINSYHPNPIIRLIATVAFKSVIRHLAMVEDQRWLKSAYVAWEKGQNIHLSDHDFGFKKYMRKFFVHEKKGVTGANQNLDLEN
ncbi:MAG: Rieske 2Fe-2S domain-containing protein [Rhodospirillaceae bacterium]|jgi:phenylpropionate dioxygenase-like ring-hydroxylating dioxygenase large terminal subunit|nr:Rieske 2Fe-2S domain-containing protein [Rhodospirillaceae bacterium]MBT3887169.1 Rieske 2Fe-2S domain-containing protein [Rhodospirillaceae bacterium]MBT4115525.1 Rieske 2Fe-2S domain-containing protein [Rhodospirillaceae bacterium]MBT4673524.1 Rieske 2Fe-2S domain-containing protein [Rhodospirillaceae bacterium]MBT4721701.1 Rieske 2Fe-2S domain-containing protein [Rhodospirillaceae bacterium]